MLRHTVTKCDGCDDEVPERERHWIDTIFLCETCFNKIEHFPLDLKKLPNFDKSDLLKSYYSKVFEIS